MPAMAVAAVALFGCAPAKPPTLGPRTVVAPGGSADATVATVRPIPSFGPAGSDPQAAILAAMSIPQAAMGTSGASSEIVAHMDGGETISVVEPDSAGLSPGERVMVVRGGLTRLVPASPRR